MWLGKNLRALRVHFFLFSTSAPDVYSDTKKIFKGHTVEMNVHIGQSHYSEITFYSATAVHSQCHYTLVKPVYLPCLNIPQKSLHENQLHVDEDALDPTVL